MGEFGAVSVVSAKISGKTNTMPLEIERLYNDYLFPQAFAVASALAILALITLGLKTLAEWKNKRQFEAGQRSLLEPTIEATR
jgi:sulfate transport system permease protein